MLGQRPGLLERGLWVSHDCLPCMLWQSLLHHNYNQSASSTNMIYEVL